MKKYIIGAFIGAFLMVSGQVMAEELSKIGKVVQGEAVVVKGKTELSNAIIVDGKSYAPVRDIVESFGSTTTYTKGVIRIEENQTDIGPADKIELLESKKRIIGREIERIEKGNLVLENETIPFFIERGKTSKTGEIPPDTQARIDELKESLAESIAKLTDLKAQVAAIDAEIAALQ